MRELKILAILALMAVFFTGCSTCQATKDPTIFKNHAYSGELKVDKTDQCFLMTIQNNSDKNIVWKWDKTVHLDNGNVTGKFTPGKESQPEDDAPVGDITIFPGTSAKRQLCPLTHRYLSRGYYPGWKYLSCGLNGVMLTLEIEGKEVHEKVLTTLN